MQTRETDRAAWSDEQARALRARQLSVIDFQNIAEEMESIMGNDLREMLRRFRILLAHLLKWEYQPEARSNSWRSTIRTQRDDIQDILNESPSLKRFVDERLKLAYPRALSIAIEETGRPASVFPSECPYTAQQVLNHDFWPGVK